MKVVFNHPPVPGSTNPFVDFNPANAAHYPPAGTNGIYINGLRLDININGVISKKFVPTYVGIGNLRSRLRSYHYNKFRSNRAGEKDLWNFSEITFTQYQIYQRYADMYYYDYINNYRINPPLYRITNDYMNELKEIQHLLFFRAKNYFNVKFGLGFNPADIYFNLNHNNVGAFFPPTPQITQIANTKLKYDKGFYFVYATIENDICDYQEHTLFLQNPVVPPVYSQSFAEGIETATKKVLNKIGIHTTAKANLNLYDMEIDLSNVQDVLVNLGDPYPVPLIISVP